MQSVIPTQTWRKRVWKQGDSTPLPCPIPYGDLSKSDGDGSTLEA